MSVLVCSAADSTYFPMLAEWLHSLRRFHANYAVGILDVGLSTPQRSWLEEQNCHLLTPEWPCPIPEWKIRGRTYLKGCVCRPFLPDYFPGYETYLWMDPDTWIQRSDILPAFLGATQNGKIALTAQVDRHYPRQMRVKWLGPLPLKLRGFYFSNAKKSFGLRTAKKLYPYHVLLAGMFALRGDAPHWKRWQELLKDALKNGKVFTAEQLTLGVLCYLEGYEKDILPGWMHWLCEYKPLWDAQRGLFVEPYTPHEPIGVLHLSGWNDMRRNRALTTEFMTPTGDTIERSYRYSAFSGESIV